VKSGDTLIGIAAKYGTTPKAIAKLNGIPVSANLHIGQVLKIP
jgi:LysM repeat protein